MYRINIIIRWYDIIKWRFGRCFDILKSWSREIVNLNHRIALIFDRHIGSIAAGVPTEFQSIHTIVNANLAASRLYEILQ